MKARQSKQWKASDFLTRAEKLKQMNLPTSSKDRVIVKSNNEALGFKFNCYEPEFLIPYVSKTRFDETVKSCQKICESVWRMKKLEEGAEYNISFKYFLSFSVIISLVAFLMLILEIYAGAENLSLAAIILLIIAAFITVVVVMLSLLSEPRFIELEPEIIGNLRDFLESENASFYRGKGLEWSVQENFFWLELAIRSKSNEILIGEKQ